MQLHTLLLYFQNNQPIAFPSELDYASFIEIRYISKKINIMEHEETPRKENVVSEDSKLSSVLKYIAKELD